MVSEIREDVKKLKTRLKDSYLGFMIYEITKSGYNIVFFKVNFKYVGCGFSNLHKE